MSHVSITHLCTTLLLLIVSTHCFSIHMKPPADKRSTMDLAIIQIYNICDSDYSGHFNDNEFECVNQLVSLFFGGG